MSPWTTPKHATADEVRVALKVASEELSSSQQLRSSSSHRSPAATSRVRRLWSEYWPTLAILAVGALYLAVLWLASMTQAHP